MIIATVQNDMVVVEHLAPAIAISDTNLVQSLIHFSVSKGFQGLSLYLLSLPQIDPSNNQNCTIAFACKGGNATVVHQLLLDQRVAPSIFCYMSAIAENHIHIVELLLTDNRVDVSENENAILALAIQFERVDICKLLLKDSRVDPSMPDNILLEAAVSTGNPHVVTLLLSDARVKPSGFLQLAAVKVIAQL